jgi:hypothetical protein
VSQRLYFWPEYAAVARMVRYETLLYEDAKPYVEELEKRFGAAKVREAVADVCQTNWHEKPVTIGLRPEVRKHCFGLLGPAPEQEDAFYRHPDGTPRPRPARKDPDALAWKSGKSSAPAPAAEEAADLPEPKATRKAGRAVANSAPEGAATPAQATGAPPVLKVVPKPEPDLRAMKRRYRTLVKAFRACPAASPARAAIKADVQALRREIRAAGGGTVI